MHILRGFSMWNLINRAIIKNRATFDVTLTMSHSVARLSFQLEIYFKRGATRILRPVAFRHQIALGLAFTFFFFLYHFFCILGFFFQGHYKRRFHRSSDPFQNVYPCRFVFRSFYCHLAFFVQKIVVHLIGMQEPCNKII